MGAPSSIHSSSGAIQNERSHKQPAPTHCHTKAFEAPKVDNLGCDCGSGCSERSQPKPKGTWIPALATVEVSPHPSGQTQYECQRVKPSYFLEHPPTPGFSTSFSQSHLTWPVRAASHRRSCFSFTVSPTVLCSGEPVGELLERPAVKATGRSP